MAYSQSTVGFDHIKILRDFFVTPIYFGWLGIGFVAVGLLLIYPALFFDESKPP